MYIAILNEIFHQIRKIGNEHSRTYQIYPGRYSSQIVTGKHDYWEISYKILYWENDKLQSEKDLKRLRQLSNAVFNVGWKNIIAIEVNVNHYAKTCGSFSSHYAASHSHTKNLGYVPGPLADKYKKNL